MSRILSLAVLAVIGSAASAQAPRPDFPDGPGKETFVAVCGGCHDINRARAGYTPEGWHTVMRMMVNFQAPIPPDQVEPLTAYLVKNFPEPPRPPAKLIDGPAKVTIKQWDVATPRLAPARSARRARRRDLVHRPALEPPGPRGSEDRRDQGISAGGAQRPARTGRGP
jgi:hypothetical protein